MDKTGGGVALNQVGLGRLTMLRSPPPVTTYAKAMRGCVSDCYDSTGTLASQSRFRQCTPRNQRTHIDSPVRQDDNPHNSR